MMNWMSLLSHEGVGLGLGEVDVLCCHSSGHQGLQLSNSPVNQTFKLIVKFVMKVAKLFDLPLPEVILLA